MQKNGSRNNRIKKNYFLLNELRQAFTDWVKKLVPFGNAAVDARGEHKALDSSKPQNADAEFLGWQETKTGEAYALYNITAEEHPLYHSTVTEKTLRQHQLEVPPTPSPQGRTTKEEY